MRRSLLVFAITGSALLAACSGTTTAGQDDSTREQPSDAPSASPAPAESTSADLDFTVAAVDGSTFRGADYAGDALAIWFWAPW